jgi:hypothetical protein
VEHAGSWVVLDARTKRVAFLSPQGDLVRVAGREGDGPGEMRVPVSVAFLNDRVAVAERSGRLVFFDSIGAPAGLARVRDPDCVLSDVHELIGGRDSLVALTWCTPRSGRVLARVERVAPDGGTRVMTEWAYNDFRSGAVDPLRLPVFGRVGDSLALGVAPDPCLRILNPRGEAVRRVCYPDLPRRPVPDSVREAMGRLQERLRSRGVATEVRISANLPAFRALVGGGHPWGFLALPPEGGEAVDWVERGRLHRIVVPEDGHVFLGRRSILVAVERAEGTSFAVLPLRERGSGDGRDPDPDPGP